MPQRRPTEKRQRVLITEQQRRDIRWCVEQMKKQQLAAQQPPPGVTPMPRPASTKFIDRARQPWPQAVGGVRGIGRLVLVQHCGGGSLDCPLVVLHDSLAAAQAAQRKLLPGDHWVCDMETRQIVMPHER
jgi:hypothetical protein